MDDIIRQLEDELCAEAMAFDEATNRYHVSLVPFLDDLLWDGAFGAIGSTGPVALAEKSVGAASCVALAKTHPVVGTLPVSD